MLIKRLKLKKVCVMLLFSLIFTGSLFLTSCNNNNNETTVPTDTTIVTTETPVVLGNIDYSKIAIYLDTSTYEAAQNRCAINDRAEFVECLIEYINMLRRCCEKFMSIDFPYIVPEEKFKDFTYVNYSSGNAYLPGQEFRTAITVNLENIDIEALAESLEQLTRDPEIDLIIFRHYHADPN